MQLTDQNLDAALWLLGKLLTNRKTAGYWLVVCGGSALLVQKITSRSTHDVDVLALRDWNGGVDGASPLPEPLKVAAGQVADELRLEANWLNSAASLHFPDLHQLPFSFWQGMETRDYGDFLRISFVTRGGQIHLKIFAALNRAQPRDFDDLRALAPSCAETEDALRWLLANIPVLAFRNKLPELLIHLGHARLIPNFEE